MLHYRRGRARAIALQQEFSRSESVVLGADLASELQVKRLFAKAVKHFGRIDTLIANAGCVVAAAGWLMRRQALVPMRDPRLAESLAFENV